ncbi:hypothetical protein ACIGEZ_17520 [Streptomyces sp. NPDC085481]|uniref:hypothetical protein n=1 Tax=Streptomyces sp. NPDC085481 TaxID=3365727 RepID=UPI0037D758F1
MAVEYASPPEVQRIAQAGFEHLARLAPYSLPAAAGKLPSPETEVTLSMPHQVHHVGLDHLVARRPLTASTVTGWRYLVLDEDAAVASSEVSASTDGRPPALEQINVGPYVQSTASALQELADVSEIRSGRYELHMLKIPALSTFLLWLRPLEENADLFVALAPAPEFLEAGHVYREDQLLDLLEGPAQRRLEFDDAPLGGYDTGQ